MHETCAFAAFAARTSGSQDLDLSMCARRGTRSPHRLACALGPVTMRSAYGENQELQETFWTVYERRGDRPARVEVGISEGDLCAPVQATGADMIVDPSNEMALKQVFGWKDRSHEPLDLDDDTWEAVDRATPSPRCPVRHVAGELEWNAYGVASSNTLIESRSQDPEAGRALGLFLHPDGRLGLEIRRTMAILT